MITPAITIVIPNTNSPLVNDIVAAIRPQLDQAAAAEILVIGSDKDGLLRLAPPARFIATPPEQSHAADKRNLGMELAQGEIILFLDDDCRPAPDWLEHHLRRHEAGEKIVGGAVDFGRDSYIQLADNVSAFHDLLAHTRPGPRPYLAAANLSVQREVFQTVGPMPPGRSRAEDLEWTVRCRQHGYRLYFEPAAVIWHRPRRTDWPALWQHWLTDAEPTLRVRLGYPEWLQTPRLARYRFMYLWGAPLVALWATLRTFWPPRTLALYWHTLPLVYLTKLAWCWQAYQAFPRVQAALRPVRD